MPAPSGGNPPSDEKEELPIGAAINAGLASDHEAKAESGIDSTDDNDELDASNEFGLKRFIYGAYLAAAAFIGFVLHKLITASWSAAAKTKATIGEPNGEVTTAIALMGALALTLYGWRKDSVRQLVEEVVSELSKVTWPSKQEVANNTMIVVLTTAFATVFFTLMDRFWSLVTNWVYGT
jgi:preprotein translocase subunit SecE